MLRIGTASWTDRSLIECGRFYPSDCTSAEARLRFYAAHFPIVEVDSSYYALPTERNSRLWVERTPDGFRFNIKAFRLFTGHATSREALPRELRPELPSSLPDSFYARGLPEPIKDELWKRFCHALLPLQHAAKLGSVLLQFPPWVKPHPRVSEYLAECRQRLAPFETAIEFRNHLWLAPDRVDATLELLRSLGLNYVAVDEPQGFASSLPPLAAVTGRLATVRFHGRNRATWEKRGLSASSERFDYRYREDELAEWLPRIAAMRSQAQEVHLIFNTNKEDQGPANALLLEALLGEGAQRNEP